MAVVTVRAPGKVSRRIAGVTFSEGRAEVDTDSAAYQFFRRRGYKIGEPPAGTPLTAEELAHDAASEAAGDQGGTPPDQSGDEPEGDAQGDEPDESTEGSEEPDESKPERPHPVQGNKAAWFDYLSKRKPDHGFDLEKVQRKELIEAANEVDGITAE